jgi:hypothetical protein
MYRTISLLIALLALAGIGWLAWSRWDAVAYLTDDYSAITGWAALRAAWPIFGLAGISTALVGLLVGGWAGEHARERDALARVATAEARATQAEEDAQHAQAEAEAALAAQRQRAERAEQEARQREAAAEQARCDAEAQLPPAYQRITELTEDNALLKRRLAGALESLERRKRQVKELRQ